MRVTVSFADRSIGIDDLFYFFESIDGNSNYTTLQWYDDHGTIEVKHGDRIWLNSIDIVQPYIDQWTATHDRVLAEKQSLANTLANVQQGVPRIVA